MQDRYAGDVGDFGKYGLLRALTSGSDGDLPLRLGVVWYLTNPEANNDGRHISYLSQEKRYRSCDPALFDLLQRLVRMGSRNVRTVREWGLLPPRTVFIEELVQLRKRRDEWCAAASRATVNADLVFLDPDNGLQVDSIGRGRSTAPKYAFYSELLPYLQRGQSLIVYHHLGQRTRTAKAEIEARLDELTNWSGLTPFALRFQGGTARAYFVIPAVTEQTRLRQRAVAFLSRGWAAPGLFEDRVYE